MPLQLPARKELMKRLYAVNRVKLFIVTTLVIIVGSASLSRPMGLSRSLRMRI